jgi:solute carrier family 25 phosphate transporter 3
MSGKLEAMKPQRKIELFSGTYFGACTLGGMIGMGPRFSLDIDT